MGRKASVSPEMVLEVRKMLENPAFNLKDVMTEFKLSYSVVKKIKDRVAPYDIEGVQLELSLNGSGNHGAEHQVTVD